MGPNGVSEIPKSFDLASAREEITQRGNNLKIPEKYTYKNLPNFIAHKNMTFDPRTGLAIMDDQVRHNLALRLAKAVKNNEKFVLIHSDADQLKAANKINRQFGDLAILYSLSQTLNSVSRGTENLSSVEAYAFRGASAGDEAYFWAFSSDAKAIDIISESSQAIDDPFQFQGLDFTFSTSYSFISADNPALAALIDQERDFALTNPDNPEYNLINKMNSMAEEQAHFYKLVTEIAALPDIKHVLDRSFEEFRDEIVDANDGKRMSGVVIKVLMNISYLKGKLDEKLSGAQKVGPEIAKLLNEQVSSMKNELERHGYPRLQSVINSLATS